MTALCACAGYPKSRCHVLQPSQAAEGGEEVAGSVFKDRTFVMAPKVRDMLRDAAGIAQEGNGQRAVALRRVLAAIQELAAARPEHSMVPLLQHISSSDSGQLSGTAWVVWKSLLYALGTSAPACALATPDTWPVLRHWLEGACMSLADIKLLEDTSPPLHSLLVTACSHSRTCPSWLSPFLLALLKVSLCLT